MDYKAIDIANFFVEAMKYDEELPTNRKLNKLVFFANGCSYQRFGMPLISEDFEAWDYGPVVPSVYQEYKSFGKAGINAPTRKVLEFPNEIVELLLDVARCYGAFTTDKLTSMTHRNGTPWKKVYRNGVKHIKINAEDIKQYFNEVEPRLIPFDEVADDIPSTGYIDEDGYTVLPKEWDDEF